MLSKRRLFSAIPAAAAIALGLFTRSHLIEFPQFVLEYVGDALWAAMVYFGLSFLAPQRKASQIALAAFIFSFGIEFSQLYQAEWINSLRANKLGALVLGHGFRWSDLLCYTAGILTAYSIGKKYSAQD